MKTNEAVRDRILRLCQEHDMTINRLATVSALPPSSIKNILYGKSRNPKLLTIKLICDGPGRRTVFKREKPCSESIILESVFLSDAALYLACFGNGPYLSADGGSDF